MSGDCFFFFFCHVRLIITRCQVFNNCVMSGDFLPYKAYYCTISGLTIAPCQAIFFLAHLSRRLKVRYCDHSPSVVVVVRLSVRPSVRSQSLNNISSSTNDWILTKLHRNDLWLVLFQSCSNGSGPLHI